LKSGATSSAGANKIKTSGTTGAVPVVGNVDIENSSAYADIGFPVFSFYFSEPIKYFYPTLLPYVGDTIPTRFKDRRA